MIPGRSAERAARTRHAVIGFASAIDALVVGAAGGAGATAMSVQATLTVEYGKTDPVDLTQNGTRGGGIGGTITANTPLTPILLEIKLQQVPRQLGPGVVRLALLGRRRMRS